MGHCEITVSWNHVRYPKNIKQLRPNHDRKAMRVDSTGSWPNPFLVLALIYQRKEHISITNPIFCPLLSTIITPNYVIRHAITDTIHWSDRNIIWHTYTLSSDSGSIKVVSFILYKLTHVPLYHLFKDMAELKSFLILLHKCLWWFHFFNQKSQVRYWSIYYFFSSSK